MTGTLIALLAAGKAQRFGGGKLDAPLQGKAVGAWALEAALALGEPLVVVTGAETLDFVPGSCRMLPNPDAAQGMGTSIRMAAKAAREAGAERLLILLADMPFVSNATLRRLLAAPDHAACRYPDGALGPPACFTRALFPALEALPPERGAGALLKSVAGLTRLTPPPRELIDIDTRQDLLDAQAL